MKGKTMQEIEVTYCPPKAAKGYTKQKNAPQRGAKGQSKWNPPVGYDESQKRRKKSGTAKMYREDTLVCQKTLRGNKAWGGRIVEYSGPIVDSNIYESQPGMIMRNGKLISVKEYNAQQRIYRRKNKKR